MTAQQQLTALGIGVDEYEGLVVVEMEQPIMSFTPSEIRRFYRYLERAYRDAMHNTDCHRSQAS